MIRISLLRVRACDGDNRRNLRILRKATVDVCQGDDRHQVGSRTDRVQPPALPLDPLGRERFKFPQRSFSRIHALCRNVILTLGHVVRSVGGAGEEPDSKSLIAGYRLMAMQPNTPQGGLEIYSLTSLSTAPSPIFHKSGEFSVFSRARRKTPPPFFVAAENAAGVRSTFASGSRDFAPSGVWRR